MPDDGTAPQKHTHTRGTLSLTTIETGQDRFLRPPGVRYPAFFAMPSSPPPLACRVAENPIRQQLLLHYTRHVTRKTGLSPFLAVIIGMISIVHDWEPLAYQRDKSSYHPTENCYRLGGLPRARTPCSVVLYHDSPLIRQMP